MTDKCKVKGSEITAQCQASTVALERGYIETGRMTDMDTSAKRYALFISKGIGKHSKAELNFCPWCGGDVMTKYKDPINRSRPASKGVKL